MTSLQLKAKEIGEKVRKLFEKASGRRDVVLSVDIEEDMEDDSTYTLEIELELIDEGVPAVSEVWKNFLEELQQKFECDLDAWVIEERKVWLYPETLEENKNFEPNILRDTNCTIRIEIFDIKGIEDLKKVEEIVDKYLLSFL